MVNQSKNKKNVYTIAASQPFLEKLVEGLWDLSNKDFLTLSTFLILLPSRRACRNLTDVFLRFFDGKPVLLPRIVALGDLEEEEIQILSSDEALIERAMSLPPAISSLKRQFLLAPLILEKSNIEMGFDQALGFAGELGSFLDEVVTEGVKPEDIRNIVPDNLANHWQQTLSFLDIVLDAWPEKLKSLGMIDPADRRNQLLELQNDFWQKKPPSSPVIAAGITGTIPAAGKLLKTIAELEKGMMVLPGVDQNLESETLNTLDELHPQHGFKRLLGMIGIDFSDVKSWVAPQDVERQKECLMTEVMRPAENADRWQDVQALTEDVVDHVSYIETNNEQEEAGVIALTLRQALEVEGQTAMLVTPDRYLARRVSSFLKRWNIDIDDSAGVPLQNTTVGTWILLTAQMIEDGFSPISLLSVLKHPLMGVKRDLNLSNLIDELEKKYLRGQRPSNGLTGLIEAVFEQDHLKTLLEEVLEVSKSFSLALSNNETPLSILKKHIAMLEKLANRGDQEGTQFVWSGDDGEAASRFLSGLIEVMKETDLKLDQHEYSYAAILKNLMQKVQVRSKFSSHPRLSILGLMESRLVSADIVIMAGLNEGMWPSLSKADPFLSRGMRQDCALPTADKQIGMSAHDFVEKFCAGKVYMTRSKRQGGAPANPARWLLRLETVLKKAGQDFKPETMLIDWLEQLDEVLEVEPIERPRPMPPSHLRPRKYSVSGISTLMRDPYSLYARKILKLEKLDPLDKKPDHSDRGNYIHKVMECFVESYPDKLDGEAHRLLLKIAKEMLPEFCPNPMQQSFWWQRFLVLSEWIIQEETKWRKSHKPVLIEQFGQIEIKGDEGVYILSAKADRIDISLDGKEIVPIDYKTGSPPSKKDMFLGFSPQLPLEGLIVQKGGYENIPAGKTVEGFHHWILKGTKDDKIDCYVPKDMSIEDFLTDTEEGVKTLLDHFVKEDSAYHPVPLENKAPSFNDYEHLARNKEWGDA